MISIKKDKTNYSAITFLLLTRKERNYTANKALNGKGNLAVKTVLSHKKLRKIKLRIWHN